MGNDVPTDFTKTSKHFEASKNEIDEEAPTNEVINEGIDTIDTIEDMTMDDVNIDIVDHLYPHQVSPCVFKGIRKVKKSYVLQHSFIDLTKGKKMFLSKFSMSSIAFDPLRLPSIEALTTITKSFSTKDKAV